MQRRAALSSLHGSGDINTNTYLEEDERLAKEIKAIGETLREKFPQSLIDLAEKGKQK